MLEDELPLPGEDGAHVSVNAEESKIKHDHSYAMQPPPYVIFLTYEDDSFNAISPPPLYEVEAVLRTTTEDDESVVGNESGDDSNDGDDNDDDDDDDDARDDEDRDPHWLPGEEKFTDDNNLLSEDENDGNCTSSTPDCQTKYLVFDSCLNKLLKRCPDCGDVVIQHKRKTIGSMLSIEFTCHSGHTTYWDSVVKKKPLGNLLMAASILFTGITLLPSVTLPHVSTFSFLVKVCITTHNKSIWSLLSMRHGRLNVNVKLKSLMGRQLSILMVMAVVTVQDTVPNMAPTH